MCKLISLQLFIS